MPIKSHLIIYRTPNHPKFSKITSKYARFPHQLNLENFTQQAGVTPQKRVSTIIISPPIFTSKDLNQFLLRSSKSSLTKVLSLYLIETLFYNVDPPQCHDIFKSLFKKLSSHHKKLTHLKLKIEVNERQTQLHSKTFKPILLFQKLQHLEISLTSAEKDSLDSLESFACYLSKHKVLPRFQSLLFNIKINPNSPHISKHEESLFALSQLFQTLQKINTYNNIRVTLDASTGAVLVQNTSIKTLPLLLKGLQILKSAKIFDCLYLNVFQVLEAIQNCPNFQNLYLHLRSDHSVKSLKSFSTILSKIQSLRTLTISYLFCDTPHFHSSYMLELNTLKQLTSLTFHLSSPKHLDDNILSGLSQSLSSLVNLEYLDFRFLVLTDYEKKITQEGVEKFIGFTENLEKLKSLTLNLRALQDKVSTKALKILNEALESYEDLKSLKIYINSPDIETEDIMELSETLAMLENLEVLDLEFEDSDWLSNEDMISFFENIAQIKYLSGLRLFICCSEIEESFRLALVQTIYQLKYLKSFELVLFRDLRSETVEGNILKGFESLQKKIDINIEYV